MTLFRHLILLAIPVVLLAACSDDDPIEVVHHVNPLWTPDGKTVVAGYDSFVATGDAVNAPRPKATRLAVMDIATRAVRVIDLGTVNTWHTLYAFDPSGNALAVIDDGRIHFHDLQGRQLVAFQPQTGGVPQLMAFGNTGNSFVWVGTTSSGYSVNLTTYDANSWSVVETVELASVGTTESVISLLLTSQRSYALRMSSGIVREVDFNGTELNSYTIGTLTADSPWHTRLVYYAHSGLRYLYAIDGEGLWRMNLNDATSSRLVRGTIVDLDLSAGRRSMVYETRTGDVWLSSEEGMPLTRMAPQNLMPRFSPAANGIATVSRYDQYRDSLQVLLYR